MARPQCVQNLVTRGQVCVACADGIRQKSLAIVDSSRATCGRAMLRHLGFPVNHGRIPFGVRSEARRSHVPCVILVECMLGWRQPAVSWRFGVEERKSEYGHDHQHDHHDHQQNRHDHQQNHQHEVIIIPPRPRPPRAL